MKTTFVTEFNLVGDSRIRAIYCDTKKQATEFLAANPVESSQIIPMSQDEATNHYLYGRGRVLQQHAEIVEKTNTLCDICQKMTETKVIGGNTICSQEVTESEWEQGKLYSDPTFVSPKRQLLTITPGTRTFGHDQR